MGRTQRDLVEWLEARAGIAHRVDLLEAGFGPHHLRRLVRERDAELIRRAWIALPHADEHLVVAARAGGRVSCVSLARRRGWWMPPGIGAQLHLHVLPGSGSTRLPEGWPGRVHWSRPVVAMTPRTLLAAEEDALAHIATCQPYETALVLWESAIRAERLPAEMLRRLSWTTLAAKRVASDVCGLSDSGLETLLVLPLRTAGIDVRQQAMVAGHFVDLLIGERLIVQIDGWEHHSSSAQRTADIAHDTQLRLRGYTVLRFSYQQIVRERYQVIRAIRQAVAQGLHRAA